MDQPIVVVGAGVGGLATALRLAHRGERVIVLERTDQVGGRNRRLKVNDCEFDAGPTLMMMLGPFRKLFTDVGECIEDHLDLRLCDPSYRVFYADGDRLDATPEADLMAQRIEEMCGVDDAARYPGFLKRLPSLYRDAIPNFVERNYRSPRDLASPSAVLTVLKHGMLGNLAKRVGKTFRDPKLRMLFSFQTMYLGLSPYEAPWVYATLAYMEFGEGIWYPKGGMVEISRSIARLAESKGVDIRLNSAVCQISGKEVILETGERIAAKAVVCNADLPYAEKTLGLAGAGRRNRRSSCSAYMLYLDYLGELPQLLHHNVFFGMDFRGNLEAIFRRNELPDDPAFYACVSARSDPAKAPSGHENLYLLVPCPNLERPWSSLDGDALRERAFDRLRREVGFDTGRVVGIREFTPIDWQNQLNLDRGAAFGLSHHFLQSAAFRPANRSRTNPNVFFVGASTVPGNGLPMVLISADLVVERMASEEVL